MYVFLFTFSLTKFKCKFSKLIGANEWMFSFADGGNDLELCV